MPKNYLKINDFSGGAVDAYDPRDLKPNQFAKVENLMLDKRSSLTTFGGEKEHSDIPSGDTIVICPGYGLFTYDTDHMKGDASYAKARDEGEHWMAITDAINGNVDLFDLSNGSVVEDKITLGTPRAFNPGVIGGEARIQVINTTATPPSSITDLFPDGPYKSDTIFLNSSDGFTSNFKFPDGDGSTWSFKVGDIVSISGHSDNTQNNINAARIKSLTPATTYGEEGSSYIDDAINRTFTGAGDGVDDIGSGTGQVNWVVYDPESEGHSLTILSGALKVVVDDTGDITLSGAKLSRHFISSDGTGNTGKSYVVSAKLQTASGTRDNMYFRLGNRTSDVFSISNAAKYYSVALNPPYYSAYEDGSGNIDASEGLVIYSTASGPDDWIIDDVNITRDGVFMQFEQRVLYRTDEVGLTGGEYGAASSLKERSEVALTLLPKTVFHFVDEALRVSDATLSTGTETSPSSPPKNQWWGYIKRIQFDIAGQTDNALNAYYTVDGWFSSDNDLPAPTDFGVVDYNDSSALTYPTTAAGFDINIHDQPTAHNDNFGTWLEGDYECVLSFIYDSYVGSQTAQESLLYPTASYSSFSVADDSSFLTISIGATSGESNGLRYDNRLSGGRVYARKKGSDDDWQLLCEIDIRRGARVKPFGEFTRWVAGTSHNQAKVSAIYSLDPNIDTYETLNGFSQNEKKLTISGVDEGYKTSVIANRRCFVANVKTQNNDGETIQMRDRVMYSPINKFDTFPRSFFLDAVKGDAEEYVKVEEYADRLLAFKQRRLHIINIQDPSPANWFIEDVKDYAGIIHHSAAVKTEMGIVWVNKEGCHHYDGKGVKNLILGRIAESTWENFVTTESSIFYHPQKFYICVLADYFGGDNNIYLYDFRTKSWIRGSSTFADNQNRTNFVEDWNGNPTVVFQPLVETTIWELMASSWGALTSSNQQWGTLATKILMPREWSDDLVEHQPNTVILQTKDYDFGEPGLIKKVYSVTVTYASDSDMSNPISYAIDGSNSFSSSFTGDFSGSGSGWKQLRATLTSPQECQSIALKISNPSATGTTEGLKINDITLEYRMLKKRVS